MADLKLLEKLCLARGISGNEDEVRDIILGEIKPYADSIEISPLGNIIAFKKGKNRSKTVYPSSVPFPMHASPDHQTDH